MSATIVNFQQRKAVVLLGAIENFDPKTPASAVRIKSLFVKHGIVSELTYWERVEHVLNDLGYDYDEIFEVLER